MMKTYHDTYLSHFVLFFISGLLTGLGVGGNTLSLAAFNLKVFGDTKYTTKPMANHVYVDQSKSHSNYTLVNKIKSKF